MASWFRDLKTWQKWAVSAVAGFVVVSIVGSIFSGDETETGPVTALTTVTPTSPGRPAPSEPPPATAPDATTTTGAPTTTTTTLPLFKVEVSGRGDDVVEVDIPAKDLPGSDIASEILSGMADQLSCANSIGTLSDPPERFVVGPLPVIAFVDAEVLDAVGKESKLPTRPGGSPKSRSLLETVRSSRCFSMLILKATRCWTMDRDNSGRRLQ